MNEEDYSPIEGGFIIMNSRNKRLWGMRGGGVGFLLGMLLVGAWAVSPETVPTLKGLLPGSTLSLSGDSTLHKYHCAATQLEALLEIDPAAAGGLADQMKKGAVRRFELTVPVEGLKSGKKQLDRNLYAALNTKANPVIVYRMSRYSISISTDGISQIEAPGVLQVSGKEREVVLKARLMADGDRAQITGKQELLMTDFDVKPPVIMMGALKTDNRVVIHYDIVIGK